MWRSKWNLDKNWIKGKERWLMLLICGLILLILAMPTGAGRTASSRMILPSGGFYESAGTGLDGDGSAQTSLQKGTGGDSQALLGKTSKNDEDAERAYEKELEDRVTEILKHVEGVGEVDVMITLKSSSEKVLHVDQTKSRSSTEEKDSSGGTRTSLSEELSEEALMAGSSGAESPVVEKELKPELSGIVISADGGGSAAVQAEISAAMEALFDLPAHKIKVLKRVE